MGYIGMCGPKGYGFSAVWVINRVSILAILPPRVAKIAILVINRVAKIAIFAILVINRVGKIANFGHK